MLSECKNNFQCWNCKEQCMAKELFELPDSIFYSHIEESLKAGAGYMLTSGYPAKEVENQKRIMTLTLVTSRMKYLEAQSNN